MDTDNIDAGFSPAPSAADLSPDGYNRVGPEPPAPTQGQTSPVGGVPRGDVGLDVPEGISSARAAEIRSEVAAADPAVFATDVQLERRELSAQERQQLREEYAAEREGVSADQVEFKSTPFEIQASIDKTGQERAAEYDIAQKYDVDPLAIDAERQPSAEGDGGQRFRGTPITDEARVSIAAAESEYDRNELAVEGDNVIVEQADGGEQRAEPMPPADPIDAPLADDQAAGDAVGQTTRTDIGPGGPSQPGPVEAAKGSARSFFTDPYGSTIGYGVEDLSQSAAGEIGDVETAASERAGFDIGRTATVTGETLADRPIDSVVTGVATIRTGAAASIDPEDIGAAGIAASGTGTGTAVGTVSAGTAAASGAVIAPAAAGYFGYQGIQEKDIALPTETAPQPGENVEEVDPNQQQFGDELEPSGANIGEQPEIEVTGETSVGASTTRIPVGETGFGEPEVSVGEDTAGPIENELPVGGEGGAGEATREGTEGGVTPDEFPVAGRDFPADPTREYVPSQGPDVGIEAAQLTGGLLEEEEGERSQGLFRDRRRGQFQRERREILQGPEEEVFIGEGPGIADEFLYQQGGQFRFPAEEATSNRLETAQEPELVDEVQTELTPETATQSQVTQDVPPLFAQEPGEMLGEGTDQTPLPAEQTVTATATAQEQELQQLFETPAQTDTGTGNPLETPPAPGFGYGTGTGQGGGPVGPPLRPPDLPDAGGDDPLSGPEDEDFDNFWSRPVATPEDIFGP